MKDSLYQGIWATIAFLEQHNFKIVKIGSRFFFSLRDERTPSALINENGSFYDFGSGQNGSVYDVLELTNRLPAGMSKVEALNYCREFLIQNFKPQGNYTPYKTLHNTKNSPIDINWFKKVFLTDELLQDSNYLKLLKGTIISVDDEKTILSVAQKYFIGYSKTNDYDCERLIMPIFNLNGEITTLWRYNPFVSKEKRLRFSKHRKRSSFNLMAIKQDINQRILLCEGERDVLNAVARGFLAVTSGSATCRFSKEELEVFKGREVMSIGDNDEAGFKFNQMNKEQLSDIVNKFTVGSFKKSLKGDIPKGFDLTDYLFLRK